MPFTFAHPAIILPLSRSKWFSLTGLVVGSMAPDFEYFIRMRVQSDYSHSLAGLLWFNLPLSLALAFIYHNIIRNKLIDNLPEFLAYRFATFKVFNWNQYFKSNAFNITVSIVLGSFSHIVWDSFTHQGGLMVETFSSFQNELLLSGKKVPIYKLLQHLSTVVGIGAMAVIVYNLPVLAFKKRSHTKSYWITVIVVSICVVLFRIALGLSVNSYGHVIVTIISGMIIGILVASSID